MDRRQFNAVAAVALVALATLGCKAKIYRAETVIHPDGSVTRAIYQPVEVTPAAARSTSDWDETTYAKRVAHEDWTGAIADLPAAQRDDDHDYFAAWGEFDSPGRIPDTYVKKAPEGLPEGKLLIDYQRNDFVLVVEHRWVELLTDIVSIDDMHRARRELADQLVPLATSVVAEVLGDEYDTTGLGQWLNETGRPWLFEMTDVVFAAGARGEFLDEDTMLALVPVCARHGLVLTDGAGRLLEDEALQRVLGEYVREVLRDTIKRRDGEKVSENTITALLEWMQLVERPENAEERYVPLDEAAKKVVTERFGSTQAFQEAMTPIMTRILGLYASEIFGKPHHFEYALELPGTIVETNGTLLSDRAVRWDFGGKSAYPFGYKMHCRSLDAQGELEQRLLGRRVLADNASQLAFVTLVGDNAELYDILHDCASKGSMTPFYRARDEAAAASKSESALDALAKLLQLPDEAPSE